MADKNPRPALTKKLKDLDTITLVGVVEDFDDDHLSIDLEPCSPGGLIIIPKSAVEVSNHKKLDCPTGETVQLSTIKAKRNTPIMKMRATTLSIELALDSSSAKGIPVLAGTSPVGVIQQPQGIIQEGTIRPLMVSIYLRNLTGNAVSYFQHWGSNWHYKGSVSPHVETWITADGYTNEPFCVAVAAPGGGPGWPQYYYGIPNNGMTITCQ